MSLSQIPQQHLNLRFLSCLRFEWKSPFLWGGSHIYFYFWSQTAKGKGQRLFSFTQGLATLPMNRIVFRATSLMRTRKGLLALKVTLLGFSERPAITTAVLAAASLPSSFTCRSHRKQALATLLVHTASPHTQTLQLLILMFPSS